MRKNASNIVANAIDWYVDKLNRINLIPVNAASLIRDISSKNISDGNFTPRPLTIDNFTNAELDAIYNLSRDVESGKFKNITADSYREYWNHLSDNGKVKGLFYYGTGDGDIPEYTRPLRSVSTTLGCASVRPDGDDHIVEDIYDFNKNKATVYKNDKGKFFIYGSNKEFNSKEDALNYFKPKNGGTAYGKFRNNSGEIGHSEDDPDTQKIKTKISLNEIKKRLGDKLGTYDMTKPWSKKEFVLKSTGAGALIGAPIGASLGAISGLILMLDKKKRKKWFRTMLLHTAAGAAIASAIGAAGGGIAANKMFNRFSKSAEKKHEEKKDVKKRNSSKSKLISTMAYVVPSAILAGVAGASFLKYKNTIDKLTRGIDRTRTTKIELADAKYMPSGDDV